jgi:DNA-directed RNA polymerase subunit RPC12/RpoP
MSDTCPECGSEFLRFGSEDPQEGTYFWCDACGCGPILYPLGYRKKFIAPIINAEDRAPISIRAEMFRKLEYEHPEIKPHWERDCR